MWLLCVQAGKALDLPVYFGDAGSSAVLHSLGAEHAACAVITLDTPGMLSSVSSCNTAVQALSDSSRTIRRSPFSYTRYYLKPIDETKSCSLGIVMHGRIHKR